MSLRKKIKHFFVVSRPPAARRFADAATLAKAPDASFPERFREVVSDPINLLIARVPAAGYVDAANQVILHNGNRVPLRGAGSYYGDFSDLLIINRGVHEPLEEYCFQQVLASLSKPCPVMLELGSYWAHYSMWLKKVHPGARCHMVESDAANLEAGRANFTVNGFTGAFHQGLVKQGGLEVDAFCREQGLTHLDILHADIQGFEAEMLAGAAEALAAHRIDRVFVSTHSEKLHLAVEAGLRAHGYHLEISSPWAHHTTSCDGFILATAPGVGRLFDGWTPLGRTEISQASPQKLMASIAPLVARV